MVFKYLINILPINTWSECHLLDEEEFSSGYEKEADGSIDFPIRARDQFEAMDTFKDVVPIYRPNDFIISITLEKL